MASSISNLKGVPSLKSKKDKKSTGFILFNSNTKFLDTDGNVLISVAITMILIVCAFSNFSKATKKLHQLKNKDLKAFVSEWKEMEKSYAK